MTTAKATGSRAQVVDGQLCLVITGQDVDGREVEVAIPGTGWQAAYELAATQLTAALNASRESFGDGWTVSRMREGTPAKVGTTSGGKVVLLAAVGTPLEVRLLFDRSHARELAAELLLCADEPPMATTRQ